VHGQGVCCCCHRCHLGHCCCRRGCHCSTCCCCRRSCPGRYRCGHSRLGHGFFPHTPVATPSSWSPPVRWRPVSAAIPQRLCYCLLHPCYYHCHPSMLSLLGGVAIATLYLSPMISRFPRHIRQLPSLTYMLSGLVYKTFGHWFPSLGMKTFGNDR
jgi:hypothetical protein